MTVIVWPGRAFRYEQRSFWREPAGKFFTVALPVLMLTVFGGLNGDSRIHELGGIRFSRYMTVGMVAFSLVTTTYGMLSARVTFRRESGIYQRLRTTPLPAGAFVAGQVLNALSVVALTIAILLVVGTTFYDGTWPTNWPLFALVLVVGAASCSAIGMAVSTFVPSGEAIDPVIWGTMMPITFISGMFEYVPPHSTIGRIASLFPVSHLLQALLRAFGLPGATGPLWEHLGVVALWGVVGGAVAVRRFRWAPHR